MKKIFIFSSYILLSCILFACQPPTANDSNMTLVESKHISFPLDSNTRNFIQTLFLYKDKSGKEYVTFQNRGKNEILFYDLDSQELAFTLRPENEGANGVGSFFGYYIHNLDSIFLTGGRPSEIALIDNNCIIRNKFNCKKTIDSLSLQTTYSTSFLYNPLIIIDEHLYTLVDACRWAKQQPIAATVNLRNKDVKALPFQYPTFPGKINKAKRYGGIEEDKSWCFDGTRFIYSFYFDEDIYVTLPDHQSIQKIKVKSQYIDKVKLPDDFGNITFKDMCEDPNYGNLLYDPYRKVYYRIAYPPTEVPNEINSLELKKYGRKNFSILILNKELQVIGETLFPDYIYNSNMMFINEDGLYISDSHTFNPDFSDDVLSFRCFTLSKKKK